MESKQDVDISRKISGSQLLEEIDELISFLNKSIYEAHQKPKQWKGPKPTKWQCQKIWDYNKNGGMYNMNELQQAFKFYNEKGFVVINDVIDEKQNIEGRKLLLSDLKELNINNHEITHNIDWNNIDNLNNLSNDMLPGWRHNGIRLQFGIAHGRFAMYSRLRPNIKKIFAFFHECSENELCCSWDSIALSPFDANHRDTLWLHADQSIYNANGDKFEGWDYHSIQGALYYTETNKESVSFVCSPESHKKYWQMIADQANIKTAHWLVLDDIYQRKINKNDNSINWKEIRRNIIDNAYRINIPQNGFVLWNSKVFHQNCDSLIQSKNDMNEIKIKRIASFISMSPSKYRKIEGFRNSVKFAINGTTSTHWSQLMIPHKSKHPRFMKGSYQNMMDIKPMLNQKINQQQFENMIPINLKGINVKIFNTNKKEPLSLSNIHHLNLYQLQQFHIKDLWNLLPQQIQSLQPWQN